MGKFRFVVIPADGDGPLAWVEGDDAYNMMRDAVGGYIEFVPVQDCPFDLVVNEEYTFATEPVPNTRATLLWAANPLGARCVEAHPMGGIYGPAIVVGPCVECDTTTLPEALGTKIMSTFAAPVFEFVTGPTVDA